MQHHKGAATRTELTREAQRRRRKRTSATEEVPPAPPQPAKRARRADRALQPPSRQRMHAVTPAPAQREEEEEEEADGGAAEQQQQQQQPGGGDDTADALKEALDMLLEAGLQEEQARQALRATEQQHCGCGAEAWAEEAQLWLLARQEEEEQAAAQQQQQEQRQQQQEGQQPSDPHQQALELLLGCEVPETRAIAALEATESFRAKGPEAWAEEAQLRVAADMELEEEQAQMRDLMQQSLEEAQQRKQQEAPLLEKGAAEVRRLFGSGPMLSALLGAGFSLASLLDGAGPLQQAVLREWLQLERNCTQKWWQCSWHYFKQQAAALLTVLPASDQRQQRVQQPPAAQPDRLAGRAGGAGNGNCSMHDDASLQQQQQQHEQEEEGERPGISITPQEGAAVMAFLLQHLPLAKDAAYGWTDDSQPPPLFAAAVPLGDSAEVVEMLSDDEGEASNGG